MENVLYVAMTSHSIGITQVICFLWSVILQLCPTQEEAQVFGLNGTILENVVMTSLFVPALH